MTERPDPARVRAWALANGWPIGERGRVSAEIYEAYEQEGGDVGTLFANGHDRRGQHVTVVHFAQDRAEAKAHALQRDGHTFAWEASAYVVRDAEGLEKFRSPLGGDCARWATERGILLSVRESNYGRLGAAVGEPRQGCPSEEDTR